MPHKGSMNPQKVPNAKVRQFDGIGGPRTQVLRRFNQQGWDISNTVCNDIADLHLGERGSALLRPGQRRLGSEDYTIGWVGQINIGGILRYGLIYNNNLTMVDMPTRLGYDLIPWPEDDVAKPADWPDGWTFYEWEPVDDVIPEDPSLPVAEQVCTVGYTWANSPASQDFTMPYAGTIAPASVNWYHKTEGYRPDIPLVGNYNAGPAWLGVQLIDGISLVLGPCLGEQIGGITFTPDGKDIDDDWLVPAVYSFTSVLTWSDGEIMSFPITLTVLGPAITLSPTEWDEPSVVVGEAGNKTKTINIKNTGDAGSSLVWEHVISGDAALVAILTADKATGTLAKDANEDIVFTMTDPGGLSAGSYSATITLRDSRLLTITGTVDVTLTVIPVFTGELNAHTVYTKYGVVTESDTTLNYRGSLLGWNPLWTQAAFISGKILYCGKLTSSGKWLVLFQDQLYWDQCGEVEAYQPVESFAANGAINGTYTWTLTCMAGSQSWVITITEL